MVSILKSLKYLIYEGQHQFFLDQGHFMKNKLHDAIFSFSVALVLILWIFETIVAWALQNYYPSCKGFWQTWMEEPKFFSSHSLDLFKITFIEILLLFEWLYDLCL